MTVTQRSLGEAGLPRVDTATLTGRVLDEAYADPHGLDVSHAVERDQRRDRHGGQRYHGAHGVAGQ